MATSHDTVRLCIRGLPPSVQDDEVKKLFASFGTIVSFERVGDKIYKTSYKRDTVEIFERRIAYISLEVKAAADAAKAVRVMNGTKWKGATLACHRARTQGVEKVLEEIHHEGNGNEIEIEEENGEGNAKERKKRPGLCLKRPLTGFRQHQLHRHCIITRPIDDEDDVNPQKIRFSDSDGDIDTIDAEKRWESIETPRQHVYNYEQYIHRQQQQDRISQGDEQTSSSGEEDDEKRERVYAPMLLPVIDTRRRGVESIDPRDHGVDSKGRNKPNKQTDQSKQQSSQRMHSLEAMQQASIIDSLLSEKKKKERRPIGLFPRVTEKDQVVDFMPHEERPQENICGGVHIDLSRFDSDSEDDDSGNLPSKRIPQRDGADDSSSEEEEDDDQRTSNRSDNDSMSTSTTASSVSRSNPDDELDSDTTSSNDINMEDSTTSAKRQDQPLLDPEDDIDLETLKTLFPNAASFYRTDPIEHIEATWRAERESCRKEFKEMRKQARRAQGITSRKH